MKSKELIAQVDKTLAEAQELLERTRFSYTIILEDSEDTFNINMHSFNCFARSKEEAVGKMCFQRSEFRRRKIQSIKMHDLKHDTTITIHEGDI